MKLRALRHALALAFALGACILHYWALRVRGVFCGRLTLIERAGWLHRSACRVSRAFCIRVQVHGLPPRHGLVVANHLSYFDIAIFSSVMPCFFVSKAEVASWPYFGKAARVGGTMFIDRRSRVSTAEVARQISDRLTLPAPVLLFPEGTSSDGSTVLRFHSSLFEPAIAASAPITPAAIRYVLADGFRERELCWFDDTLFLPHLWKALGTPGFSAQVTFGEPRVYSDRRGAAEATHEEIVGIRKLAELSAISSQLSVPSGEQGAESAWPEARTDS